MPVRGVGLDGVDVEGLQGERPLAIESEIELVGLVPVGAFFEDFDEFGVRDAVWVAVVEELEEVFGGVAGGVVGLGWGGFGGGGGVVVFGWGLLGFGFGEFGRGGAHGSGGWGVVVVGWGLVVGSERLVGESELVWEMA